MRLIDADALAARLENECREFEGESAYQAGLCAAAVIVAEAPTVKQEPTIMTYEEVIEYTTGNPYIVQERTPLYVQFKEDHEFTLGWRHAIDIGAMIERRKERGVNDYGRTWVCWTARPTDEQRKAVKFGGKTD